MRAIGYLGILATSLLCSPLLSAQTVRVSLNSPESGDTVTPGTAVHWQIDLSVSGGNNAGLALLVVDLAQDKTNPELFDIQPADGVPSSLANFSRPAGISNPGETNPVTGYVGVQRGEAGQKDLKQIGGAQNTFGEAMAPGSGIAENANVITGIGQSGPVTLASGVIIAPNTPGLYSFHLGSATANVIESHAGPQRVTSVAEATVLMPIQSIVFEVASTPCESCDVNCDGASNGLDLQSLVDSIVTGTSPTCSACAGDLNGSGDVSSADVVPFISCLLGN